MKQLIVIVTMIGAILVLPNFYDNSLSGYASPSRIPIIEWHWEDVFGHGEGGHNCIEVTKKDGTKMTVCGTFIIEEDGK
jgi:hypothetical protein